MNLRSYSAMLISIMLAAQLGSAQTSAQPDALTKKVDALFARWETDRVRNLEAKAAFNVAMSVSNDLEPLIFGASSRP